jgi:hypothetical protein
MSVDARYPIGRFTPPAEITHSLQHEWITSIAVLPQQLREIVRDMSDNDLESRYREGGWTVRQIIHHIADSHMNSYCRYRLALTEDSPVIRTYNEAAWAELPDASRGPVDLSLNLIKALHTRWVALLKAMDAAAFQRTFRYPDQEPRTLNEITGLYAWHGRHHLAHIRLARGLAASV